MHRRRPRHRASHRNSALKKPTKGRLSDAVVAVRRMTPLKQTRANMEHSAFTISVATANTCGSRNAKLRGSHECSCNNRSILLRCISLRLARNRSRAMSAIWSLLGAKRTDANVAEGPSLTPCRTSADNVQASYSPARAVLCLSGNRNRLGSLQRGSGAHARNGRDPAVDQEVCPDDVRRIVRREVNCQLRDFQRIGHPLAWIVGSQGRP